MNPRDAYPPQEDDPLLDSLLEEVLGGHAPPDLSGRILEAWSRRSVAPPPPPETGPLAPPVASPSVSLPPGRAHGHVSPAILRGKKASSRTVSAWAAVAIVCTLLLAVGLAFYFNRPSVDGPQHVAEQSPAEGAPVAPPRPRDDVPEVPDRGHFGTPPAGAGALAENASNAADGGSTPAIASSDEEIIAFVDSVIEHYWEINGIEPSPPEDDAKWARRVYLGVLGRIPSLAELESFTASTSPYKRQELVDRLLNDAQYTEEYARNWASVWTNALIGRGDDPDDMANRLGLEQYVLSAMRDGRPLDGMAYELITATGSPLPGSDQFNGATNFLLAGMNDGMTLATARTSRVFLGTQVQCAQCHSHPFHEYDQRQFWEMNAFFRQMHVEGSGRDLRLVNRDFVGEGTRPDLDEAEVYYEGRDGRLFAAYPVFLDGQSISRSGRVDQVDRRAELARLVTDSPRFSQAMVNRIWSHFFGYGFANPVDDMGPHTTPSHPEILDRLAQELIARGYDQKELIRWIVLSEPYALSSRRVEANEGDDPTLGSVPLFSHYYSRPMQPEAAYDSLRLAASGAPILGRFESDAEQRDRWLGQFLVVYGTDEGDESLNFAGSVSQTLAMMNGDLIRQATSKESASFLRKLAAADLTSSEKVEQLFLAAVARKPSPGELDAANRLLTARGGDVGGALADMWWALLNSNEFILDH